MYRGENDPSAVWTTSTATVTTKPVSAAIAPMMAASTVVAVESEYCQFAGTETVSSRRGSNSPSTAPRIPPRNGITQMLLFRYCLIQKRLPHDIAASFARRSGAAIVRRG